MTQPSDTSHIINTVAPALRMLIKSNGLPSRVRTAPEAPAKITISLSSSPDNQSAVVHELASAMKNTGAPVSVSVKGVASFEVSPATPSSGRAAGKIAVVTGAAQGFGLEIAQDLAAQGATVVLADINIAGAQKAAEAICKTFGADRALGLELNVTDGTSVRSMVQSVVKHYGGFDVFISNAGVLKAGSVKAQLEKDFDFTTNVNYKGYFLCVQAAAPVLAAQHIADKSYMSDIIQINSKSGLEGSNRNGAYAGSKFGGIGLTQSFALELIEDGIKVNSICPGNFFDGPLWSHPETGLFVQYLKSGKVPGAKTVEDVRKAYESKVPMGRGCTTPDVMKAIYYLMEQEYETGQAVPVTGGQVMLK